MIDEKTLLRHNVVEEASALVKTISQEEAEMLYTFIKYGSTQGQYDEEELKRYEEFCTKLRDLAQAVQDYEA